MSIFAIADLHLTGVAGEAKSMAKFDDVWIGCREKLKKNWDALIEPEDTVVLPGDFSWAMTLEEAEADFAFVNSLPGRKLLGKGNHDFWWSTANKMNGFFAQKGFDTLGILYNNAYNISGVSVCGTRGWFPDPENQKTVGETDWQKISDREKMRLRHSLEAAGSEPGERIVFIHFPPVWRGFCCDDLVDIMLEYGVRRCYYGHIHGIYSSEGDFDYRGIRFEMISADHLNFAPKPVFLGKKQSF